MVRLSTKNKIILAFLIVLVLIISFVLLRRTSFYHSPFKHGVVVSNPIESEVKKTEQVETTKHKEDLSNNVIAPDKSGGKKTVSPVITSATVTEIRAFIPDLVEDDGTCTAQFAQDTTNFEKSSKGFINVSSTNCEPINIQRSEFPKSGSWTVKLKYTSSSSEGISQITTLEVE